MRSLRLKFPDTEQRIPSVDWACFFIGLVILLGVLYQYNVATKAINYWNLHIEYIEKKQNPKKMQRLLSSSQNRGTSQEVRKEIKNANVILERINFPWEALFDSIENATSKDIALLSLLPNVSKQSLRIGGEARNMSVLLDFVKAMEHETIFVNTHLLNYKIKKGSSQQPVLFQITTSWSEVT
jgi:hypothetical protein